MKGGRLDPLDNTNFPNRDIIKSFQELSRHYMYNMLDNRTLPHRKIVKISYNDGSLSSNEICLAMMHTCRRFGSVALIESEINYLDNRYDDVFSITYNKIMRKDLDLELENPIKSIIVKDYETNSPLHGGKVEEQIQIYFRDLNYQITEENFDARNLYPCFFLVN